jgi:hypothetical protein
VYTRAPACSAACAECEVSCATLVLAAPPVLAAAWNFKPGCKCFLTIRFEEFWVRLSFLPPQSTTEHSIGRASIGKCSSKHRAAFDCLFFLPGTQLRARSDDAAKMSKVRRPGQRAVPAQAHTKRTSTASSLRPPPPRSRGLSPVQRTRARTAHTCPPPPLPAGGPGARHPHRRLRGNALPRRNAGGLRGRAGGRQGRLHDPARQARELQPAGGRGMPGWRSDRLLGPAGGPRAEEPAARSTSLPVRLPHSALLT